MQALRQNLECSVALCFPDEYPAYKARVKALVRYVF